eukprot:CAMPEP_0117531334 /NCGR_PEP_ID=MMETSP0784-20121206/38806_1 /TAXON_ID=39447 /ORGANISM="" /LENGTH=313 /DNA_ID=CAMNT_0005327707 /DNA_START=14 /DNA_END=953 /DNA_ORIENTATION=-
MLPSPNQGHMQSSTSFQSSVLQQQPPFSEQLGFAALKPSSSEAAAQLVELMRLTLRHAQEIAVGEAEASAVRAQKAAAAAEASTTDAERDQVEIEVERLRAAFVGATGPSPNSGGAGVGQDALRLVDRRFPSSRFDDGALVERTQSMRTHAAPALRGDGGGDRQSLSVGHVSQRGASASPPVEAPPPESATSCHGKGGGSPDVAVAAQMTTEIEATVMWVQQLLESVHFVESDAPLDPGASLLSIVQPRLRHQKDEALHRSLKLFSQKKEEEQEFDTQAAFFRGQALAAVAAQRERLQSSYDELWKAAPALSR